MEEIQENCLPSQSPILFLFKTKAHNKPTNDRFSQCLAPSYFRPEKVVLVQEAREAKQRDCRICLQGQEGGKLSKYCLCTGTAELCHEQCLQSWISHKLSQTKMRVHCEVCLKEYDYDCQVDQKFDCSNFKQNFDRKRRKIISFMGIYLIILVAFFAFVGFLIESIQEKGPLHAVTSSGRLASIGLIIILMFWGILMVIAASAFVKECFFRKEIKINAREFVKTNLRRYASLDVCFQLRARSFQR